MLQLVATQAEAASFRATLVQMQVVSVTSQVEFWTMAVTIHVNYDVRVWCQLPIYLSPQVVELQKECALYSLHRLARSD